MRKAMNHEIDVGGNQYQTKKAHIITRCSSCLSFTSRGGVQPRSQADASLCLVSPQSHRRA